MFQLIYNEEESKRREGINEVYILHYRNKIYYSMSLRNPAKIVICRRYKHMYINNLSVESEEEKEFAREIFKFILQLKDVLEIEEYTMNDKTSSSEYYIELYGEYII